MKGKKVNMERKKWQEANIYREKEPLMTGYSKGHTAMKKIRGRKNAIISPW